MTKGELAYRILNNEPEALYQLLIEGYCVAGYKESFFGLNWDGSVSRAIINEEQVKILVVFVGESRYKDLEETTQVFVKIMFFGKEILSDAFDKPDSFNDLVTCAKGVFCDAVKLVKLFNE